LKRISTDEALFLLKKEDFHKLAKRANEIKRELHNNDIVTFIVDRNINYTNICINKCKFCAFHRDGQDDDAYILSKEEIFKKIEETIVLGGTQILIQGGINPGLDIDYYKGLLESIKSRYKINIHGFSPAEIEFLSKKHNLSYQETLLSLKESGLDSIPGGGAEILSDRVRAIISPSKISSQEWLNVMETAHSIGMKTTATMMFGSIESYEEIISHLDSIRTLQDKTGGFTAFIPWTFQRGNTKLVKEYDIKPASAVDYLKVIAVSRIFLDNIRNIQASWVTQGLKLAQVTLFFGANDFGSTMIEENVVRSTGLSNIISMNDIIYAIKQVGFRPVQRDTYYNHIKEF